MSEREPNDDSTLTRLNNAIRSAFAAALPNEFTDEPDPANDNPSINRHRLAGCVNATGDNHGNHERAGHQHPGAPVVKATHVEVDIEEWRFLRAQAIRWRLPLSEVVGQFVRGAVTGGVPVEAANQDVERRQTRGRRATAFTRLYGISDEVWMEFKAQAAQAGVTVARAVGMLAEFAAGEVRRQTETAKPPREYPARPRDETASEGRQR